MPQTLLALFAIVLGGQLMLTWQSDRVRSHENLVRIELEAQARGVAGEVFETLATKPFDSVAAPSSPADLTPEAAFGAGLALEDVVDVDDAHLLAPYTASRIITDPNGDPQQLDFEVTATVEYVTDASGAELVATGGAPTYYKMVTVTIRNPYLSRFFGTDEGVRVARVYSYLH